MKKIFVLLAMLFAPYIVYAGSAVLSWTAPTTYNDGSPLTVANYRIYSRSTNTVYKSFIEVPGSVTTYTMSSLASGATYSFVVTARDAVGMESAYSNEVAKYIPFPIPSAPASLTVLAGTIPSSLTTFGTVTTGAEVYKYLSLSNPSRSQTQVTSIVSNNSTFTVNPSLPITLLPGSTKRIRVKCYPLNQGLHIGSLSVETTNGNFNLPLSVVGL